MNEEPFGPIAPCAPVDSMDEALTISNSLSMGLAAFVFTNSIERADYLSRELQSWLGRGQCVHKPWR